MKEQSAVRRTVLGSPEKQDQEIVMLAVGFHSERRQKYQIWQLPASQA